MAEDRISQATRLAPLGLALLVATACGPTATGEAGGTGSAAQTAVAVPTPARPADAFRVGVPVAGKPDPADPSFLAAQDGLYDPAQFASTQYYLTGYHWKLDRSIDARNITSARVQFDPELQAWAIVVDFDAAGAAEWSAVTTGAFRAGQGTPANRIAVLRQGRRVGTRGGQSVLHLDGDPGELY